MKWNTRLTYLLAKLILLPVHKFAVIIMILHDITQALTWYIVYVCHKQLAMMFIFGTILFHEQEMLKQAGAELCQALAKLA